MLQVVRHLLLIIPGIVSWKEMALLRDAAKHTTGTTTNATNGADRASQTLKNVVICSEAVKSSEV